MTNRILLKRSGTADAVPSGNLSHGELALNYNNGNLYFLNASNNITLLASANSANGFSTVAVATQSNIVANSSGVLNFSGGAGVNITTDPGTGTITFSTTSGVSIFSTGGDMGTVVEAVTATEDLGSITTAYSVAYDLGTLILTGMMWPDQLKLPSFTVSGLPNVTPAGQMIFVSNASGGSIPAFSDGTNWRRVDDRSVVI